MTKIISILFTILISLFANTVFAQGFSAPTADPIKLKERTPPGTRGQPAQCWQYADSATHTIMLSCNAALYSSVVTSSYLGNFVDNITAGTAIDVTGTPAPGWEPTVSWDSTEVNNTTWGDGTLASILRTYNVSVGTDPVVTYTDNAVNISTGILQQGGTAVVLQSRSIIAGTGLSGGGDFSSDRTIAVDSTETGFLTAGALTCGAATSGKAMVHTTPLQYCDNAATPALQYTAYGTIDGKATGLNTNWVVGATEGNLIDISGTPGEGWSPTVAVDLTEMGAATTMGDGTQASMAITHNTSGAADVVETYTDGTVRLLSSGAANTDLAITTNVGGNPRLYFRDADVATGISTLPFTTDTLLLVTNVGGTAGGGAFYGAATGTVAGLGLYGANVTASATDPVVVISGQKKSGTSYFGSLAATDKLLAIQNNGTELVSINGAGNWTFPNATTVTLANSAIALNFDTSTLNIDALNNFVVLGAGVGTAPLTINTPSAVYDVKFLEMIDPTAAGSSIRFMENASGAAVFAPAIAMSSVGFNGLGGVLIGEVPAARDSYVAGLAAFQMRGQRVGGAALTSSDIWNLSNYTTTILRVPYNTAPMVFPVAAATVNGSSLVATTTGVLSYRPPGRAQITICGDQTTVAANTVYYGPNRTLAANATGLTCDLTALGNITEATVDEPAFDALTFQVLSQVCRNTIDANADVSYTLRTAGGATTPSVTCTIADNGRDCTTNVGTTTVIASAATLAIAVASAGDLDANGFVCTLEVAF